MVAIFMLCYIALRNCTGIMLCSRILGNSTIAMSDRSLRANNHLIFTLANRSYTIRLNDRAIIQFHRGIPYFCHIAIWTDDFGTIGDRTVFMQHRIGRECVPVCIFDICTHNCTIGKLNCAIRVYFCTVRELLVPSCNCCSVACVKRFVRIECCSFRHRNRRLCRRRGIKSAIRSPMAVFIFFSHTISCRNIVFRSIRLTLILVIYLTSTCIHRHCPLFILTQKTLCRKLALCHCRCDIPCFHIVHDRVPSTLLIDTKTILFSPLFGIVILLLGHIPAGSTLHFSESLIKFLVQCFCKGTAVFCHSSGFCHIRCTGESLGCTHGPPSKRTAFGRALSKPTSCTAKNCTF